jgi:FtsP/CotA-like multicopper oxidase with cupredoxin domain
MHQMDLQGMVMNENTDRLPRDCQQIAQDVEIAVHAGKQYAHQFPGTMFAYDRQEWHVPACARVKVTLINDDQVRHQWMVHGLPRYLYPEGMFHLEANGGYRKTGTFIVPSGAKTYLVHCDVAHHTEKGMKAQLKVAGGDGDLPSIPGLTGHRYPDAYGGAWGWTVLGVTLLSGLAGLALAFALLSRLR